MESHKPREAIDRGTPPRHGSVMDLPLTIAGLVLGVALVASMSIIERRPRKDFRPKFPTTPFMFVGGIVTMLALVHLVNLAGFHTGR